MVPDAFWWASAPALCVGLAVSLLMELLLVPAPNPVWQRPAGTWAVHAGLWGLLYSLMLLIVVWRPWLAAVLSLTVVMAVVVVNNAKFSSLREPFIVHDFEYFTDAIRYPRLYLPFLRVNATVIAVSVAVISALVGAVWWEPTLVSRFSLTPSVKGLLGIAMGSGGLLALGNAARLPVSYTPTVDLRHLGLLTSLWRYAVEARRPVRLVSPFSNLPLTHRTGAERPHIVVVQSESFFDPRALWPEIHADTLATFDATCAESLAHGPLRVPAWGANTVRTEFSFLSGLSAAAQGVHQFQPYHRLARLGLPQLVSTLREAGYRTICIHPYLASFYGRDRIFADFGFETFIDVRAFSRADYAGPYVGDLAVADKIQKMLQDDDQRPVFVFAITMENHGPLHLEQGLPTEMTTCYQTPPPAGCTDLTIYLRHLRNADRMLKALRTHLDDSARPGCLCWYGDHVPIMPQVYAALGAPDGRTHYCLWRSDQRRRDADAAEIGVEDLALQLCVVAGLLPG